MIGSGRLLNVRAPGGNDALRIRGSYSLLSCPSLPTTGKMRKGPLNPEVWMQGVYTFEDGTLIAGPGVQ